MKPSIKIEQFINRMLPKNYDDVMVAELRVKAIIQYLDEFYELNGGK